VRSQLIIINVCSKCMVKQLCMWVLFSREWAWLTKLKQKEQNLMTCWIVWEKVLFLWSPPFFVEILRVWFLIFKFVPQECSEVFLLHDSAEPCKCVHHWGHHWVWIESISTHSYSPDFTLSDFHLFVTLKDNLLRLNVQMARHSRVPRICCCRGRKATFTG